MKWIKYVVLPVGGVALATTTSLAIALPLYIKSKAEDAISNFIQTDGPSNTLSKDKKLKYVALGDSITAGYEGFTGKDFVSFADFLANDLKNADKLESYHNFATTGDKIWDTYNNTILNPANSHAMEDADLVTVTLGANDLLVAIRLLKISLTSIVPTSGSFVPNELRQYIDWNVNNGVTFDETLKLALASLNQVEDELKDNDYTGIISLQPELQDTIYDLVKRNLMIWDGDIHRVAPNARIILLSPYLPFFNLSDSILNGKVEENKNRSLIEMYKKFTNVYSEVANYNNFTEHIALEDMPSFVANLADEDKYIDLYGKKVPRALPNVADIHPSTYGHELLGNDLFDIIAKRIGIDDPDKYHSHGREANTDNIMEIYDSKTKKFSPEYYDERNSDGKDNSGVDRSLATIVSNFLKIEKDDTSIGKFVADNAQSVIDLLLNTESSASYKYSSTDKDGFNLVDSGDIVNQEIPETDGEEIGDMLENGTNQTLNQIVNSVFIMVGEMAQADYESLREKLVNNITGYSIDKLKVDEGGTVSEISWDDYHKDPHTKKVLGIVSVKTTHPTLAEWSDHEAAYQEALNNALGENGKIGNTNFAGSSKMIPAAGKVLAFDFEKFGLNDLSKGLFKMKLIGTIGKLFAVGDQPSKIFDVNEDQNFLTELTSTHFFKSLIEDEQDNKDDADAEDSPYDYINKMAQASPDIDIDKLTQEQKVFKEELMNNHPSFKETWFEDLTNDVLASFKKARETQEAIDKLPEGPDKDKLQATLGTPEGGFETASAFITFFATKNPTEDQLGALKPLTKEVFTNKDDSGALVGLNSLIAYMQVVTAHPEDTVDWGIMDVKQYIILSGETLHKFVRQTLLDNKDHKFDELVKLFEKLDDGGNRMSQLLDPTIPV